MNGRIVVIMLALALCAAAVSLAGGEDAAKSARSERAAARAAAKGKPVIEKVVKSDEEWKRLLTPEQYRVLRREGTERAFTGKYWDHHGQGTYLCAACGLELFSSETKFDSGTGWPSYWAPVAGEHIAQVVDHSLGMTRIEVECARCGGHLGHLFDDGPKPTGLRYCINSASLEFAAKK